MWQHLQVKVNYGIKENESISFSFGPQREIYTTQGERGAEIEEGEITSPPTTSSSAQAQLMHVTWTSLLMLKTLDNVNIENGYQSQH